MMPLSINSSEIAKYIYSCYMRSKLVHNKYKIRSYDDRYCFLWTGIYHLPSEISVFTNETKNRNCTKTFT